MGITRVFASGYIGLHGRVGCVHSTLDPSLATPRSQGLDQVVVDRSRYWSRFGSVDPKSRCAASQQENFAVRSAVNTVMPRLTSLKQRQLSAAVPDYRRDLPVSVYALGQFTTVGAVSLNRVVKIQEDGTLDTAFNSNLGTGFNDTTRRVLQLRDGSVLIAGSHTEFDGVAISGLIKLRADGTKDTAFNSNLGTGFSGAVFALGEQTDGRILVGGDFTALDGSSRVRLVRLNADGTVDTAFYTNLGTAFNSSVLAIDVQSDGKILVGGTFTTFNGNTRNKLVRLNSDGTEDTAFYSNLGTGFNFEIADIALQPDDKILVGGSFDTFNGNSRRRLVRLNSDGTEDTVFNNNLGTGFSSSLGNTSIYTIALQSDGKIVVGGQIGSFNGVTRRYLVRLNSDGTEDAGFYTNLGTAFNDSVQATALQSDGKIVVGGNFTTLNGNTRSRLVRLNADGTEDTAFYTNLGTGAGGPVNGLTASRNLPPAATYSVAAEVNNLDQGQEITFNVTTVNVNDGTVLRWRILDQPQLFTTVTGTSTVSNNVAPVQIRARLLGGTFTPEKNFRLTISSAFASQIAISDPVVFNKIGRLDTTWDNSNVNFGSFQLNCAIVQPDGKILVGGGATGDIDQLARFNALGGLDPGFSTVQDPPSDGRLVGGTVRQMRLQPDGKILIVGSFVLEVIVFGSLGTRRHLLRFNSDGSLDNGFDIGIGPNLGGETWAIDLQSDGKILIGGFFSFFAGRTSQNLVRLNSDGSADTSFQDPLVNSRVKVIKVQADGKILIGGQFTSVAGVTRRHIARLNADGTLDTGFDANAIYATHNLADVLSIEIQSDDKIIIGCWIIGIGNQRANVLRLNPDGTEDTVFNENVARGRAASDIINAVAIQPDGKILVSARQTLGGIVRRGLARLNTDGTLDLAYTLGAAGFPSGPTNGIAIQPDGKAIVTGQFSAYDGRITGPVVRLLPTDESVAFNLELPNGDFSEVTTSTVTVRTLGVPNGTTLYWSIDTNTAEFVTNSGSFTITDNVGTFNIIPKIDALTDGTDFFNLSIRLDSVSGTIVAQATSLRLNDTSKSPTITTTPTSSVDEGISITFTVGVGPTGLADGETLYWTSDNNTDITPTEGSFTISGGQGTFSVSVIADQTTEGSETFQVQIRTGSTSGPIIVTRTTTINDTSIN